MALRVGFDLDGVLADLDRAILDISIRLFGPDQVGTPADDARPRLSSSQAHLAWAMALDTPDFWETLSETEPGIVARIDREARARGWDVVFITQRPSTAGDPVDDQTRRWLARNGFADARVVVAPPSRGLTVANLDLDVAVDDRAENCASIVAESRARAVLVWHESRGPLHEDALAPGITVVQTVTDALDRLLPSHDGSGPSEAGSIRS